MDIAYNYEIISTDAAARCMEVRYTSAGRAPVHVSTRLPYMGESLEAVVAMYSPVAYWREQESVVEVPQIGLTGSYSPPNAPATSLEQAKAMKRQEIAAWRYQLEVGGVEVNGVSIRTDRESQSMLTGAFSSLKDGLVSSIDWKSASGVFVTLTITEVGAIAQAVAQHVQSSFTSEKQYSAQVDAATSIEEVSAITLPWPSNYSIPVVSL